MTAYFLSWCSVLNSLQFDMQHGYFHKKIWFDLLTPPPWSRVSLWAKYLLSCCCKGCQLKFDMQYDHILKSLILASAPPPKSTPGAQTQAITLKSRLICFISIAALPACKILAKKILTIALIIAKFKYLTFDPLGGVKGGGVKF